jgi:hypothetical protein
MFLVFCIMNSLPVALMSQQLAQQNVEPIMTFELGVHSQNKNIKDSELLFIDRIKNKKRAVTFTAMAFFSPIIINPLFELLLPAGIGLYLVANAVLIGYSFLLGSAVHYWDKAMELTPEEEFAVECQSYGARAQLKHLVLALVESVGGLVLLLEAVLAPALYLYLWGLFRVIPAAIFPFAVVGWIGCKLVEAGAYNFKKFLNGFSSKPKGSLKERKQQARVRGALV